MTGLMILANGFEDVEGLATIDILRRAKVNLTCVTLKNTTITTAHRNKIVFDKSIKDVDYKKYDFLILPGGAAVFNELNSSAIVEQIVKYFCDNEKLVCAICAAPLLIGKYGYFKDLEYTCFPGCESQISAGIRVDKPLVYCKNYLTARSMYYACDFALEIVSLVKGTDIAIEIAKQIKGL